MDMGSSSDDSSTMMMGMMTPWLHFKGGDNLYFHSWAPSSKGAIAGACIGLIVLSILERWISAIRLVLDARWKKRWVAIAARLDWSYDCIDINSRFVEMTVIPSV